jgi:regulator of sirC expression with transglutaminase-like and TPR domain
MRLQDRFRNRALGQFLLGALLASLTACGVIQADVRPPSGLEERILRSDPLHPDFEEAFEKGEKLFECLLAVDRFICPELDGARVRAAFESLVAQTNLDLKKLLRGRNRTATPEEASSAFLRTLGSRGFVYGSASSSPGVPDSKMVSGALLRRTGCCGTFSLLLMAYLDRMNLSSSIVCLPDHCFVRVHQGDHSRDIESTDFESPLRQDYVKSDELAGKAEGGHYGRSLDFEKTLWHYYVDRLWVWNAWRCTDEFALRALARARVVLGSSCQSIEFQEALRYSQIARGGEGTEDRRLAAWAESHGRFETLHRNHPGERDYAHALVELEAMSGFAHAGSPEGALARMTGELAR